MVALHLQARDSVRFIGTCINTGSARKAAGNFFNINVVRPEVP